jgi:hypothetical protein
MEEVTLDALLHATDAAIHPQINPPAAPPRKQHRRVAAKPLPPPAPMVLPNRYGVNYLSLIEVEPCRVFAHWELCEAELGPAQQRLLKAGRLVIRVYDVTCVLFNGRNAHGCFDIEINRSHHCWHIGLPFPDRSVLAELGVRDRNGGFVALVRSNCVQTARACPAGDGALQWMHVDGAPRNQRRVPREHVANAPTGSTAPFDRADSAPARDLMSSICREDVVKAYARLCETKAAPIEHGAVRP